MKRAIVIGASSGIGRGLAQILVTNGYMTGITGRRVDLLNDLKSESPESYVVKELDNTKFETLERDLEELVSKLGGLDLLVLSSGTGKRNPELDYSYEKMTVDLNVSAFTQIVVWTYKYFEKQGYGHLLTISSIAGTRGNRFAPSYSASKSFQMKYMEGLIQKSKHSSAKINITDIRPGFVDTDMGNGAGAFWIAPVDKAVKQIYKRAVVKHQNVVYVTKRWWFVALLFRSVPSFIYKRI